MLDDTFVFLHILVFDDLATPLMGEGCHDIAKFSTKYISFMSDYFIYSTRILSIEFPL